MVSPFSPNAQTQHFGSIWSGRSISRTTGVPEKIAKDLFGIDKSCYRIGLSNFVWKHNNTSITSYGRWIATGLPKVSCSYSGGHIWLTLSPISVYFSWCKSSLLAIPQSIKFRDLVMRSNLDRFWLRIFGKYLSVKAVFDNIRFMTDLVDR